MKSRLSVLFAFSILLGFASLALAAPRAAVDQPIFDFGTVAQGKKVDHAFTIINSGDAPLTIGQVSTSCGCTVAEVSSRSIPPGKSSTIKASFDSTNFSGKISKTIYIHTNDPKTPVYNLIIKGNLFEQIEINPKQLNLGEIKVGTKKEITISIENKGTQPLTVISAKTAMPQVEAKILKKKLKTGESGTIAVKVTPRVGDRFLAGYLTIMTSSPEKPQITIPVYASAVK
jgi:uncharacterized membrane protein